MDKHERNYCSPLQGKALEKQYDLKIKTKNSSVWSLIVTSDIYYVWTIMYGL